MATCIAMLRGINVSGHNTIAMADLRALFEALGHTDVVTHVQSGNVVFTSRAGKPTDLARAIEPEIAEHLGLDVTVLMRTKAEMVKAVAGNPLLKRGVDTAHLHVTFLKERPPPSRVADIDATRFAPDTFAVRNREVYLLCPNGYGRTKLNNTFFERTLATPATTRNWRTVTKLVELAGR